MSKKEKSIKSDYGNDNENENNEEELNQTEMQETQTNNINQTGMIVTKSGDITINSLTIVGQIVISDNKTLHKNILAII